MKKILVIIIPFLLTTSLYSRSSDRYLYKEYRNPHKAKPKRRLLRKKPKKRIVKKRVRKKLSKPKKRVVQQRVNKTKFHRLFGKTGMYYSGVEIGKAYLSREVTLNSKTTGEILYRSDNGNALGKANGSTYHFNQSFVYTKMALVGGFVERKSGDTYQLSYYTNDLVQDILFSIAYSYKKFGYKYMFSSIPYMMVDAGFGHTGTTNGIPTNFSLGLGVGAYKFVGNFRVSGGFKYQKRSWVTLDKSIGKEKWDDSETTFYFGASYLF